MTEVTRKPFFMNGPLVGRETRHGKMIYYSTDEWVGRSLDLYGQFSYGESELFRNIVMPKDTALDIGANIGAFSLDLGDIVGPEGLVYAFEPQRQLFQILCANLALNLRHNIRPYCAAMGELPGSIMVPWLDPINTVNFGGVSLGAWTTGERVSVVPLDKMHLIDAGVQFMKIDVEGMELSVLKGAVNILKRFRPTLYVENDRGENSAALIQFLLDLDYKLWWHLTWLYEADNFYGSLENKFGRTASINMLCVPQARYAGAMAALDKLKGRPSTALIRRIPSADDVWQGHWDEPHTP